VVWRENAACGFDFQGALQGETVHENAARLCLPALHEGDAKGGTGARGSRGPGRESPGLAPLRAAIEANRAGKAATPRSAEREGRLKDGQGFHPAGRRAGQNQAFKRSSRGRRGEGNLSGSWKGDSPRKRLPGRSGRMVRAQAGGGRPARQRASGDRGGPTFAGWAGQGFSIGPEFESGPGQGAARPGRDSRIWVEADIQRGWGVGPLREISGRAI